MTAAGPEAAFARLRRDLLRRRWAGIEPLLRVELAGIAALLGVFEFWQLRIRYAGIAFAHHDARGTTDAAWRVGIDLAALLLVTCVLAGFAAAAAHRRRLDHGGGPGLAWAGLPAPPHLIADHLAWESRLPASLSGLIGVPALIAASDVVPAMGLVVLAAGAAVTLVVSTRAGCAMALRLAPRAPQAPHDASRITAVLARVPVHSERRRLRAPAWRSGGPARALARKDARLLWRVPQTRARAGLALLLAAGAAMASVFVRDPSAAHVLALGCALAAVAAVGQTLLALAATDPWALLRTLPLSAAAAWRARASWAAGGLALILVALSPAVLRLTPDAYGTMLAFLTLAGAAVLVLAVNYAVTLYPHTDHADRLYGFSLGLAVVGSLMIPLLGWIVLISAVIHSARRLPRWWQLEHRA